MYSPRIREYLNGYQHYLVNLDGFKDALKKESIGVEDCPCEKTSSGYELFLSRFLIATKGDIKKAVGGLKVHLKWHQTNEVEKLVRVPGGEALGCSKHGNVDSLCDKTRWIYGKDKKGHPVVYAKADVKAIRKLIDGHSLQSLLNYHIWCQENLFRDIDAEGKVSQCTAVIDFSGLTISGALQGSITSFYKNQFHIDQNHYPERCNKIILKNVPKIFSIVWSVAKKWIDPITAKKITVCRCQSSGCNNTCLTSIIDVDQIPKDYDGTGFSLTDNDLLCSYLNARINKQNNSRPECSVVDEICPVEKDTCSANTANITAYCAAKINIEIPTTGQNVTQAS